MSAATNLSPMECEALASLFKRPAMRGCAWVLDMPSSVIVDLEARGLVRGVDGPVASKFKRLTATVELTEAGETAVVGMAR